MKKGNENGHQLLAHMELIDDELIENAALSPKKHLLKNRTWRTVLPLAASFAVVVMVVIGVMVGSDIINANATERETYLVFGEEEYWFVRPEPPYVDREVAGTIHKGMKAYDVIALIGKPNRYVRFYNFNYYQWDLDDGGWLMVDLIPAYDSADYMFVRSVYIYSAVDGVDFTTEFPFEMDFESLWQNTDETIVDPESIFSETDSNIES